MRPVLFLFCCGICISCTSAEEDIPEIEIRMYLELYDTFKCYIFPERLYLNEGFQVKVSNNFDIQFGRCYTKTNMTIITWDHLNRLSYNTTKLTASLKMNDVWKCKFSFIYPDDRKVDLPCHDETIKVMDPVMGYLALNGEKVPMNKSDRHEASASHTFFNGELLNISCHSAENENYDLRMTYNNAFLNSSKIIGKLKGSVQTYVKLTSASDGAYVDCYFDNKSDSLKDLYTIRLHLKLKEPSGKGVLGFQVNKLTLSPIVNHEKGKQFLLHKYIYYDQERVVVSSLKDNNKYGTFKCDIKGEDIPEELKSLISIWTEGNSSIQFTTTLRTEEHKNILLDCEVGITDEEDSRYYVSLLLIPVYINYTPLITGLSMSNLIIQSIILDEIKMEYEFDNDTNLVLTCLRSQYDTPQWNIDPTIVTKSENKKGSTSISGKKYNYITDNFTIPNNSQTNISISCDYKTRVYLIRRKRNESLEIDQDEQKANVKTVIYAACGATMVVAFVTVCWFIVRLRIRKLASPYPDQTVLDVLGHEEDPVFIQQCGIHTSEPGAANTNARTLDELYSKPIPKHLRKKPIDPTYTELEFNNANRDDISYATVGDCEQSRRGEVVPNRVRGDIERSEYAEIYADGCSRANNYVNVFDSSVNTRDTESPYCNVIVKDNRIVFKP